MRLGPAIVILVLLAPLAVATSVGGELLVHGSASFPKNTTSHATPLALFIQDASSIRSFSATAPTIKVSLFEDSMVAADLMLMRPMYVVDTHRPTWTATEATIMIEPARPGWVGLHPHGGVLSQSHPDGLDIAPTLRARVGNGDAAPDRDDPSRSYYLVEVEHPSFILESGWWSYDGSGAIKTLGPRVTITTAQNTTTFETGEMPDPENPGRTLLRWLVIEAPGFTMTATASTTMALEDLYATWDGRATLESARGTLQTEAMTWLADGEPVSMDGAFEAFMEPISGTAVRLELTGEMRSTTMTTRVAAPATAGAAPWMLLLAVFGLAVASTAVHLYMKRQRDFTPEAYARLAEMAADGEDFAEALRWVRLAREQSPTSQRLALDQAYYFARSGDATRALVILNKNMLADDPDAQLYRARLYAEAGEIDAGAAALVCALTLSPVVLLDVETDTTYAVLMDHKDVKRATREARRKLQ